ncbi:MAG TPA: hypothetical protein VG847_15680, partial [Chitinophagaceae bacterium]|nr:hypothetical protein [Chitinophagaceae bacterium]
MQQRISKELDQRLDNNDYSESQLTELKIPINLPYQTNWSEYQRCKGEIELNGMIYNYVKRKVVNDTLYLMCIPNVQRTHLETAKNEFFRLSNDLMQNNGSKKSDNSKVSFKSLQGDYDEYIFALSASNNYLGSGDFYPLAHADKLISSPRVSPEQPPDIVAA